MLKDGGGQAVMWEHPFKNIQGIIKCNLQWTTIVSAFPASALFFVKAFIFSFGNHLLIHTAGDADISTAPGREQNP